MKKVLALVLVAMMCLCMLASAETTVTKIVFATNPEFPPFEYVDGDGILNGCDGIDMAIALKIAELAGCEVEMQIMEFDSLIGAIESNMIDASIAGMTVTETRKESVDFSIPYYVATQVIIVKEDSDITCAADLADKAIAVVQGYTGEVVVDEMGLKYEAFKKGTECIMELMNGKCDAVVIDSATAQAYLAETEGLKIVEDAEAFEGEEYAIAVSKDKPEVLAVINAAVEELLNSGYISEISAYYIDKQGE